jgi:hypothetical protein
MFDFMLAYKALDVWVKEVNSSGLKLNIFLRDKTPKPVAVVQVIGPSVSGQFSVWQTGEADFEVYKGSSVVNHRWGMDLTNESVSAAFHEFVEEIRKYE